MDLLDSQVLGRGVVHAAGQDDAPATLVEGDLEQDGRRARSLAADAKRAPLAQIVRDRAVPPGTLDALAGRRPLADPGLRSGQPGPTGFRVERVARAPGQVVLHADEGVVDRGLAGRLAHPYGTLRQAGETGREDGSHCRQSRHIHLD